MFIVVGIIEIIIDILILRWLLRQRPGERFSKKLVRKALLLGALSVILTLAVGFVIEPDFLPQTMHPVPRGLLMVLITAAILEEVLKYLAFRLSIWKSREVNTVLDAVLISTVVALGFAMLENIQYSSSAGGWQAIFRILLPCHLVFGAVMGYYCGKAKETGERKYHAASLLVPILMHFIFDAPIGVLSMIPDISAADTDIAQMPYGNLMVATLIAMLVIVILALIAIVRTFVKIHKASREGALQTAGTESPLPEENTRPKEENEP